MVGFCEGMRLCFGLKFEGNQTGNHANFGREKEYIAYWYIEVAYTYTGKAECSFAWQKN